MRPTRFSVSVLIFWRGSYDALTIETRSLTPSENVFNFSSGLRAQLSIVYYAEKNIAHGTQEARSSVDIGFDALYGNYYETQVLSVGLNYEF